MIYFNPKGTSESLRDIVRNLRRRVHLRLLPSALIGTQVQPSLNEMAECFPRLNEYFILVDLTLTFKAPCSLLTEEKPFEI